MMERDTLGAQNKQQKKELSSLRYMILTYVKYTLYSVAKAERERVLYT